MTTTTWPFDSFPVDRLSWTRQRAALSGGPAMSGPGQEAMVDGGGWWMCKAGPTLVGDAASARAWRALMLQADGGVGRFDVPFLEESVIAHTATLHAAALLRAVNLSLSIDVAVVAGEAFSITHTSGQKRLYMAQSVGALAAGVQAIVIRPPLREATTMGTALDFATPSCFMKLPDTKGDSWGEFESDFVAKPSLLLVEAFDTPG